MSKKQEKIQEILEQFYCGDVGPYDSQCFIEELAERGYQVVKVRKHAPRPAQAVIAEFLKTMYSNEGEDPSSYQYYLEDIDEDILIGDLADAGYQIVKVEEGK